MVCGVAADITNSCMRNMSDDDSIEQPICHLVFDSSPGDNSAKMYLAQNGGTPRTSRSHSFHAEAIDLYKPFHNCFGPMDLGSIFRFIAILDDEKRNSAPAPLVYCAEPGPRGLANAIFLLGSYMTLKMGWQPCDVWARFRDLEAMMEPFKDANCSHTSFDLKMVDCWEALKRGKDLQWLEVQSECDQVGIEERDVDVCVMIPNRLIFLAGTKGQEQNESDGCVGLRGHQTLFRKLGVNAIIRMCASTHDTQPHRNGVIDHYSLPIEDHRLPSLSSVARFFNILDNATGLIAVDSGRGLGRALSLFALYLIHSYGFRAAEAVAWLHMARPGPSAGGQMEFLCSVEAALDEIHNPRPAEAADASVDADGRNPLGPPPRSPARPLQRSSSWSSSLDDINLRGDTEPPRPKSPFTATVARGHGSLSGPGPVRRGLKKSASWSPEESASAGPDLRLARRMAEAMHRRSVTQRVRANSDTSTAEAPARAIKALPSKATALIHLGGAAELARVPWPAGAGSLLPDDIALRITAAVNSRSTALPKQQGQSRSSSPAAGALYRTGSVLAAGRDIARFSGGLGAMHGRPIRVLI